MASDTEASAGRSQPLIVCDSDAPNLALRCAGGQLVHTTAELLIMLSPRVLRDVVETARADHDQQRDGEQLAVTKQPPGYTRSRSCTPACCLKTSLRSTG
jgi:hypothetical protein